MNSNHINSRSTKFRVRVHRLYYSEVLVMIGIPTLVWVSVTVLSALAMFRLIEVGSTAVLPYLAVWTFSMVTVVPFVVALFIGFYRYYCRKHGVGCLYW